MGADAAAPGRLLTQTLRTALVLLAAANLWFEFFSLISLKVRPRSRARDRSRPCSVGLARSHHAAAALTPPAPAPSSPPRRSTRSAARR